MEIVYGKREFDAVLHSCWEAPDGQNAAFFVNWQKTAQTITISSEEGKRELTLEPLSALQLRFSSMVGDSDVKKECKNVVI